MAKLSNKPNKEKYIKWTLLPYFGSWIFGLMLVAVSSIVTAIVRKTVDGAKDIELIPDNILDYSLNLFKIFSAVPIAWLLGNTGIRLMELFVEMKSGIKAKERDVAEND